MKQINLTRDQENNKIIAGKTVKDISYIAESSTTDTQLIITFTDNTYIYLTTTIDEYAETMFRNGQIIPLENYVCFPANVVINKDGNKTIKYRYAIEEQIRLGLVKPNKEKELAKIKEYEESKERSNKRDYELYLKLKKKFEH